MKYFRFNTIRAAKDFVREHDSCCSIPDHPDIVKVYSANADTLYDALHAYAVEVDPPPETP